MENKETHPPSLHGRPALRTPWQGPVTQRPAWKRRCPVGDLSHVSSVLWPGCSPPEIDILGRGAHEVRQQTNKRSPAPPRVPPNTTSLPGSQSSRGSEGRQPGWGPRGQMVGKQGISSTLPKSLQTRPPCQASQGRVRRWMARAGALDSQDKGREPCSSSGPSPNDVIPISRMMWRQGGNRGPFPDLPPPP